MAGFKNVHPPNGFASHAATRSWQRFLHTPREGSKWEGRVTLMSCNECGSQGRGDRLSASLTLRDTSWLAFFFFFPLDTGGSFICLLAFLFWEVGF